jgi:hypothetical protein
VISQEKRLEILKELQRVNKKQISNREKTLELSMKLEEDIANEKIRMDIKKLEIENIALNKRDKELVSKL